VQFILVRHARPKVVINSPEIANPGLDELGIWQAARLTDWLLNEDIDYVITSPKRRAMETVQAICDERGLTPEIVDELDEIDRFCHSYYPTEILQSEGKALWDQIVAGNFADVGWDTPETFYERINVAWQKLYERAPGNKVLVSGHGGTVRAILANVSGNPKASFRTDYAAISRIGVFVDKEGSSHPHILSTNETGHFDATRETTQGPMRGAPEVPWTGQRRSITAPR